MANVYCLVTSTVLSAAHLLTSLQMQYLGTWSRALLLTNASSLPFAPVRTRRAKDSLRLQSPASCRALLEIKQLSPACMTWLLSPASTPIYSPNSCRVSNTHSPTLSHLPVCLRLLHTLRLDPNVTSPALGDPYTVLTEHQPVSP